MQSEFKYWAFISYSHADKRWAGWLRKRLEGYHIPKKIAACLPCDETVRKRHFHIFRDRDESAAAQNLPVILQTALGASRYLIVICSSDAARSWWVNEEVRYFKSLGRKKRVFCLLVGGKPINCVLPECFPPAVLHAMDADGHPGEKLPEPLAPDVRKEGDGKSRAFYKLVAGLLDVNFDDLWRRVMRQRLWRTLWVSLAIATVASLLLMVLRREAINQVTEQGRMHLRGGNIEPAFQSLATAYARGGSTPQLRFLLHQAKLARPTQGGGGHKGEVWFANFSPDGTRAVTAGMDGKAIVWDVASGQMHYGPLQHSRCVNSARFSPDGKMIVTASNDGTAKLWDAATGKPLPPPFDLHLGTNDPYVYPAFFNKSGNRLVTGGSRVGKVYVWDVASRSQVGKTMEHHLKSAKSKEIEIDYAEFSPDEQLVITACKNTEAVIWNATTGERIETLEHNGGLRFANFSPDGMRIVTCGFGNEARLWRRDGSLITKLPIEGSCSHIRRAAFSPDGRKLVTTADDGLPRLWDGLTGKFLRPFVGGHGKQVMIYDVAYSTNTGLIATGGEDKLVVWHEDGTQLNVEGEGHQGPVKGVQFSPDGKKLSSAGSYGKAYIWDVSDGMSVRLISPLPADRISMAAASSGLNTFSDHAGFITVARFSRDDRRVVTADSQGKACLWENLTNSYKKLDPFPFGPTPIREAELDASGNLLVTGDAVGNVVVWDVSARTNVVSIHFGGLIESVQFVSDRQLIAVSGHADPARSVKSVKFFNLPKGDSTMHDFDKFGLPAFSSDGRRFAVTTESNEVELRRVNDGRAEGTLDTKARAVGFSQDGRRLVTVNLDGTVSVWNAASRKHIKTFGDKIEFAALDPQGKRIVTLREGQTQREGDEYHAKLWDARTGRLIAQLEGDQDYQVSPHIESLPLAAIFSPDGAIVVTQNFAKWVKLWDATNGRLLARLDGHPGIITAMAFSHDGTRLLTGSEKGTVRMWDTSYETDTPRQITELARGLAPPANASGKRSVTDKVKK
jgi:WD40 repeat protein